MSPEAKCDNPKMRISNRAARSSTTLRLRRAVVFGAAAICCFRSPSLSTRAFAPAPSSSDLRAPPSSSSSAARRHRVCFPSSTAALASTSTPDAASSEPPVTPPTLLLSHEDVEWRLRLPEGAPRLDRWKTRIGAKLLRADCKIKGQALPPVLCPRGGRASLEAYYRAPGKIRKSKIARFGITTAPGPSCAEIDDTIREVYQINPPPLAANIAAVVYMHVKPEYRGQNVGSLALEVISAIHSVQAVDFTVLVADDNGSGNLVRWYETNGFSKAPAMQDALGSPGGKFGTTMIAPVRVEEGFFDRCTVKWW